MRAARHADQPEIALKDVLPMAAVPNAFVDQQENHCIARRELPITDILRDPALPLAKAIGAPVYVASIRADVTFYATRSAI